MVRTIILVLILLSASSRWLLLAPFPFERGTPQEHQNHLSHCCRATSRSPVPSSSHALSGHSLALTTTACAEPIQHVHMLSYATQKVAYDSGWNLGMHPTSHSYLPGRTKTRNNAGSALRRVRVRGAECGELWKLHSEAQALHWLLMFMVQD